MREIETNWPMVNGVLEFRPMQRAAGLLDDDKGQEQIEENPALKYWADVLNFGEAVAIEMRKESGS